MTWNDVICSFVFGVGLGILIGGLIVAIIIGLGTKKFCPTCGEMYKGNSIYCELDGTLLKERGN